MFSRQSSIAWVNRHSSYEVYCESLVSTIGKTRWSLSRWIHISISNFGVTHRTRMNEALMSLGSKG